jgi:hypothetical protein
MRKINAIILLAVGYVLLLLLFSPLIGMYQKQKEEPLKPAIYLTRTDKLRVFDGSVVWVVEYTVDGVLQSVVFNSPEEAVDYTEYLGVIGNVYKKEAGE